MACRQQSNGFPPPPPGYNGEPPPPCLIRVGPIQRLPNCEQFSKNGPFGLLIRFKYGLLSESRLPNWRDCFFRLVSNGLRPSILRSSLLDDHHRPLPISRNLTAMWAKQRTQVNRPSFLNPFSSRQGAHPPSLGQHGRGCMTGGRTWVSLAVREKHMSTQQSPTGLRGAPDGQDTPKGDVLSVRVPTLRLTDQRVLDMPSVVLSAHQPDPTVPNADQSHFDQFGARARERLVGSSRSIARGKPTR